MLHQLSNLPDNELMARARKLKDEEAAGILLDRYSHLLAAVSLPSLDNYGNTPDEFFPSLLQRLFKSLHTQTIPKIGEWMQFFVKSQGSRSTRNTYYFPSSASSDISRLEYKVEKANTNLLQKEHIANTMKATFDQLDRDDRLILKEFYLEQKTFAEMAADSGNTIEEVRKMIKRSRQELASQVMERLDNEKYEKRKAAEDLTYAHEEDVALMPAYAEELRVAPVYAEQVVLATAFDEEVAVAPITTVKKPATIVVFENSQNQEQVINTGYAKFGKQGQDVKDIQQGSLF